MTANITEQLCKVCDGRIECAPTAVLLISLLHTLYGPMSPTPDYFGKNKLRVPKGDVGFHIKPTPHEPPLHEVEYDFVVVGGGTAGCVLASRLSENQKWKVLLIEAGPEEPRMAVIPAVTSDFHGSNLDWNYSMRPKKGFCENRDTNGCEIIQGRVLGGTSSINDLAYMRGAAADYNEWAIMGNYNWDYSHVLPYFKYSEGNYDKDVSRNTLFHSTQGPLDVGRYQYTDANVDVLLSALNELGYKHTDINGRDQLGFMRIQTMSYFGERVSSYTAFIEAIRRIRTNLHIVTEALVTKINFLDEDDVMYATGVNYLKNGTKTKIKVSKEVIISAGAINSPKLLMQSGIGPREYLEYLGITSYRDLAVGSNFHDHLSVCLPVIKLHNKTATTKNFQDKLEDISTYYTKGMGPLSANFQVVALIETALSDIMNSADIEVRFKGHNSNMYYKYMDVCVSLLTPKSRGTVVLNASDPIFGNPLIYPNFLKDPTDEQKLQLGIQEIVKLFDTEVFRDAEYEFDPRAMLNNECKDYEKVSSDFWLCIIKQFSSPLHNYVGTCKMGPVNDPTTVVDQDLVVHGVSNLRVVDASVMPKITRGSTAAPVIMIAEKASDLIKKAWYGFYMLFYFFLTLSTVKRLTLVIFPVFK